MDQKKAFFLMSTYSRNYMTNHGRENIKQALRDLACAAGLEHRGWFNPGSSWYGEARRIR